MWVQDSAMGAPSLLTPFYPQAGAYLSVSRSLGLSGRRRWRRTEHVDPAAFLVQPPGEGQQQHPDEQGEEADQPGDGQGAGDGSDDEDDPEDHRQSAAHDEQPLVRDHLAKSDGTDDAEYAHHDRPGSDDVEDRQRGDVGPHKRDHARGDACHALAYLPAPAVLDPEG